MFYRDGSGDRAAPIVAMILAEAGNPDVRDLADASELQRSRGTATVARHVAEHFGLAPDLTVDEAADILWTLTAPETIIRLVDRRGWSWDRYESWLGKAMANGILGRPRSATPRA